jgi:hypothetical protein
MDSAAMVDRIARAVLYEGYILYPYRPSTKNRRRWTFGAICPRAYIEAQSASDVWMMQTQCIVAGSARTSIEIRLRFLHVISRTVGELIHPIDEMPQDGEPLFRTVEALEIDGRRLQTWQEAEERAVPAGDLQLDDLAVSPRRHDFSFPARRELEPVRNGSGRIAAVLIREQQAVRGSIEIAAEPKTADTFVLTVRIANLTPVEDAAAITRDEIMPRSFASAHTVLKAVDGEFVSMTDPPRELGQIADQCRNIGTWPVLVGDTGDRHTVLSAPIILSDYPEVAPESPGDLFDGTEIDEILTLRILTLTDEEKRQIAATDERARSLLARTEALTQEQLLKLHGAFRDRDQPPQSIMAGGVELKTGDRVRLWPKRQSDIFDIALRGRTAIITKIEQDYENRVHFAVAVEDDPGIDFAFDGEPAHRFFFSPEEVELIRRADGDAK